jgi:hypothetical protein
MKKIILILLFLILISFKTADNLSVYNVPLKASAVCAADQDLDGDMDIFTEHIIDSETQWGGTYILQNDGYGHFSYMDSIYDSTGMHDVYADTVLNNVYPDIISGNGEYVNFLSYDGENYSQTRFFMGTNINEFAIGDVDNNGHIDVVFISNLEQYWGVIYNQGNSSFTTPEYFYVDYPPTDIACGDLNADGRYDVVVTGASCEIYFSTETGFEMQPLQDNALNVIISDMDNDGDMDIITFSDAYIMSFVHLYENLGNNLFDTVNNFNINEGCSDFIVTDFNNDNLPDALFATYNTDGEYILYYNLGNFQMGDSTYINIENYTVDWKNMYCADMDGNSYTDILITRMIFDTTIAPSILEILFNDGKGNFVENPLSAIEKLQSHNKISLKCYPNPFINEIDFECSTEKNARVMLAIYDISGKLIKGLTSDEINIGQYGKLMKTHKITWDGTGNNGQYCKPGLYIAALEINGALQQTIKVLKY